jgi:hypothetical protein
MYVFGMSMLNGYLWDKFLILQAHPIRPPDRTLSRSNSLASLRKKNTPGLGRAYLNLV